MKAFYIPLLVVLVSGACSPMQNMNASMEDDIYYVPNSKPLVVKEVENITGQKINMTAPENGGALVINRQKGTAEYVSTSALAAQADDILNDPYAPESTALYTNTGYWVGGFNGNDADLQEAARIINRYPEGFGFIYNGQDIALNLAFSSDWNVYTDNGRYWWFPSPSNIRLYNSFLFGTYPKYIWTVVWNEPFYDSFTFDTQFNWGWSGPGWRLNFGWNTGIYRPWYTPWYGSYHYWGGWYDPFWGPNWYPGWHRPHWHYPHPHYPAWGGNYPPAVSRPNRPSNPRPNYGSSSVGLRPGINRPGNSARPNYNNPRPGSSVRPGTNSARPGNNTGTQTGTTRPNYNNGRPTTTNPRPNNTTTARPTTARPTNNNSRPATVRPGNNGTTNRYTRPTTSTSTSKSNNVKNYNRQPNNYRPNYNSNRTYNQNNNTNRSYTAPSTSSPSRNGATYSSPSRSTSRSGGRR